MMEIKGNRKHLNLSDRINIEKGLNSSDSFKEIARTIQKDPTTVAKEVRRNARVKEYKGYGNIPCEATRSVHGSAVCAINSAAVISARHTSRSSVQSF